MLADAIEGLVQRRKTLLSVKDEIRQLVTVQRGRALELPRLEQIAGVANLEETSSGIRRGDRTDQLLGRIRIPYEVPLEVREAALSVMDRCQQLTDGQRIRRPGLRRSLDGHEPLLRDGCRHRRPYVRSGRSGRKSHEAAGLTPEGGGAQSGGFAPG